MTDDDIRIVPEESEWRLIPNKHKEMWEELKSKIQQYFELLNNRSTDAYRLGKLDGLEDVQEFMNELEKKNAPKIL